MNEWSPWVSPGLGSTASLEKPIVRLSTEGKENINQHST